MVPVLVTLRCRLLYSMDESLDPKSMSSSASDIVIRSSCNELAAMPDVEETMRVIEVGGANALVVFGDDRVDEAMNAKNALTAIRDGTIVVYIY